ncbi:activating molecule in BECN1-regulated autophagy protein 1-like [Lineus longissimus]|uniref:activating molecule in BECN1-regulated autophagy protein 1-like n=1 Tax=Lineus longissimus TaxID=88925 RepID=UPI00315DC89D
MKRKKHSVLSYLVRREYGQHLRGDGRDIGHLFVEDKATDPAVNKPCALSGQARSTFVMVFSPDGTKVASTHGDHTVRVSDLATGKCLHILRGHPRTPWSVAFHPSSSDILASGCLGGDVRIWDLKGGGSEVWKVPNNNSNVIASLTFHPSDHLLVIASANVVYFWDWNLPEPIVSRSTNNDYEQIRWVKFDPLGQHLFTGIANGSTVQREDSLHHVSHFGYSNDDPYMDPHRAGLRRQYYDLVSRYNQHQRDSFGYDSIHTSAGRTGTTPSGSTYTQSATQSSTLDIDLLEPMSPTRLTALDDARQYASIVTNISNRSHTSPTAGGDNVPRSLASFSSQSLNNSDATENLRNSSSLSSPPRYRGRWRYVSREPGAASRLSGFLRNSQNSQSGSQQHDSSESSPRDRYERFSEPLRSSPRERPSEAMRSSNLRASLHRYLKTKKEESPTVKKSGDGGGPSHRAAATPNDGAIGSGRDLASRHLKQETDKSSESVDTSQNSILLSHLASSEPHLSKTSTTKVSMTGAQRSKPSFVPRVSGSDGATADDQSRETRPRSSLLRSWLKSTKYKSSSGASNTDGNSEPGQNPGTSGHNATRDPNRNTARSVTVIRPSTVDLPRILGSHDMSREASSEDLESRATARVNGSGATGTGSMHCERCLTSRNLVLHESLPRSLTPPQPLYGAPAPCNQADVSCETDDNTNSSQHRSIGTETNKAGCRKCSPHSDNKGKGKPFSSFSKRHDLGESESSRETPVSTKSDSDCDEPPRKRIKSDPSVSDSKNVSDGSSHALHSKTDANASANAQNDPESGSSRVSCLRDAVCSSSSDHIKSDSDPVLDRESDPAVDTRNQEPLPGPSSRIGLFRPTPSNSMSNVYQPSTSGSTSPASTSPGSRDREESTCTLPNCSNFRGISQSHDTNPGDNSSRMHTNLSRRYHRLHDFRQRILDIHDRLQQRQRSRSVQDRLRLARPPRSASFQDRVEALRQERLRTVDRYARHRLDRGNLPAGPYVIPHITITRPPDSPPIPEPEPEDEPDDRQEMLRDLENMRMEAMRTRHAIRTRERTWQHQQGQQGRTWHQLQRRYLHPHYAVGILDETINQPNDSIQSAINRAIAGVYLGNGETAVANNIVDKTYRIQRWYFDVQDIPYIDQADENIVVPHCKLHNDTSAEISQDGHLLATFVPSHRGFPDDTILAVYSLEPDTLGQCWYTKGFGPNAISVSISPLNQYVLVGLAARRLAWVFSQSQQVAQVYSLCNKEEGELSMKHVTDIMHPCDSETRTHHISVNSAKWLPGPGEGIMYGTNRGDLHICRPGKKGPYTSRGDDSSSGPPPSPSSSIHNMPSQNLRRNLMEMLGLQVPRTISTATQTPPGPQRTTSTQTLVFGSDDSTSDSE